MLVTLLYGCTIWVMSLIFLNHSDVNRNIPASFHSMMGGNAHRPFVYRRLLPAMANFTAWLTPDGFQDRVEAQWARSSTMEHFAEKFHVEDGYLYESVVGFAYMVLFLLLYALALRKCGQEMLGTKGLTQHVPPLVGLLILPPLFNFGYIYDFPVLGLSACCYLTLYRQKWIPYLLFFTLTCLNKETALLFGLVYGLTMMTKLPTKSFFTLGGIQAGIFLLIRGFLMWRFAGNYGENMRSHLDWQLRSLIEPYSFVSFMGLVGFGMLITYRWREKPAFVKQAIWMTLPLTILYFMGGGPGELRVFYEVVPLIVLLMSHTVLYWKMRPSEERLTFAG